MLLSPHSTLFVGDLSVICLESHLTELFQDYGKVLNCEIKKGNTAFPFLGYGFITMSTAKEAKCAMENLNGVRLLGRNLRIHWAHNHKICEEPSSAGVSFSFIAEQIDFLIFEQTLHDLFSTLGCEVIDVVFKDFNIDERSQVQHGTGVIHYSLTPEGVLAAKLAVEQFAHTVIKDITYKCELSTNLKETLIKRPELDVPYEPQHSVVFEKEGDKDNDNYDNSSFDDENQLQMKPHKPPVYMTAPVELPYVTVEEYRHVIDHGDAMLIAERALKNRNVPVLSTPPVPTVPTPVLGQKGMSFIEHNEHHSNRPYNMEESGKRGVLHSGKDFIGPDMDGPIMSPHMSGFTEPPLPSHFDMHGRPLPPEVGGPGFDHTSQFQEFGHDQYWHEDQDRYSLPEYGGSFEPYGSMDFDVGLKMDAGMNMGIKPSHRFQDHAFTEEIAYQQQQRVHRQSIPPPGVNYPPPPPSQLVGPPYEQQHQQRHFRHQNHQQQKQHQHRQQQQQQQQRYQPKMTAPDRKGWHHVYGGHGKSVLENRPGQLRYPNRRYGEIPQPDFVPVEVFERHGLPLPQVITTPVVKQAFDEVDERVNGQPQPHHQQQRKTHLQQPQQHRSDNTSQQYPAKQHPMPQHQLPAPNTERFLKKKLSDLAQNPDEHVPYSELSARRVHLNHTQHQEQSQRSQQPHVFVNQGERHQPKAPVNPAQVMRTPPVQPWQEYINEEDYDVTEEESGDYFTDVSDAFLSSRSASSAHHRGMMSRRPPPPSLPSQQVFNSSIGSYNSHFGRSSSNSSSREASTDRSGSIESQQFYGQHHHHHQKGGYEEDFSPQHSRSQERVHGPNGHALRPTYSKDITLSSHNSSSNYSSSRTTLFATPSSDSFYQSDPQFVSVPSGTSDFKERLNLRQYNMQQSSNSHFEISSSQSELVQDDQNNNNHNVDGVTFQTGFIDNDDDSTMHDIDEHSMYGMREMPLSASISAHPQRQQQHQQQGHGIPSSRYDNHHYDEQDQQKFSGAF